MNNILILLEVSGICKTIVLFQLLSCQILMKYLNWNLSIDHFTIPSHARDLDSVIRMRALD